MAAITGKNLYLDFGGTVLDTDYRSFSQSEEMGLVDASAGSDANRTYLTTLKDGTASTTIVYQASGTLVWDALVPGTNGTLTWAEEGTTSGKSKHTVWATVVSREKSMEYADLAVADIEFQFNSAVSDTAYA
jgi:hypothetical protein